MDLQTDLHMMQIVPDAFGFSAAQCRPAREVADILLTDVLAHHWADRADGPIGGLSKPPRNGTTHSLSLETTSNGVYHCGEARNRLPSTVPGSRRDIVAWNGRTGLSPFCEFAIIADWARSRHSLSPYHMEFGPVATWNSSPTP